MLNIFKKIRERKDKEAFESICKDAQLLCTEHGHIYECVDWHYETATYRSLATGKEFKDEELKAFENCSGNRINGEKCYFVCETKEMLQWVDDGGKMLEPLLFKGLLYIYHQNHALYNEYDTLILAHYWDELIAECLEKYYPDVYEFVENNDFDEKTNDEVVEIPLTEEDKEIVQETQSYYKINDGIMAVAFSALESFLEDFMEEQTQGEEEVESDV